MIIKISTTFRIFSGAEIRQSIIEAMYHAFYEQREFTTDDICLALNELIPLAQLENNQTLKLQNWASSGEFVSIFKIYLSKLNYINETRFFRINSRFKICNHILLIIASLVLLEQLLNKINQLKLIN